MHKAFLRPLLTYASPGWFPFLSVTNITKLNHLSRAASRAITGCLSSCPIPLLLSEASLPPLQITLTHFALSSYERALRFPTFFPISGLAILGVKPRFCRSSWRAFASTHWLMLPSTSPRDALLVSFLSAPWNLPFFTMECTLSFPCSRSNHPLFCQGRALAHLDCLPSHDLVLWTDRSVPFFLARVALAYLPNARSVALRPPFPFRQVQYAQVFLLKPAPFCMLFAGLSTNKSATSLLFLFDSRFIPTPLSSPPSFLLSQTLWQIWQELSSLSSCSIRVQWIPNLRFSWGTTQLVS